MLFLVKGLLELDWLGKRLMYLLVERILEHIRAKKCNLCAKF